MRCALKIRSLQPGQCAVELKNLRILHFSTQQVISSNGKHIIMQPHCDVCEHFMMTIAGGLPKKYPKNHGRPFGETTSQLSLRWQARLL